MLLICSGVLLLVGRDRSARAKVEAKKEALASQGYPVDDQSFDTYAKQLQSSEFTDEWLDLIDAATSEKMTLSQTDLPVLGNAELSVPPPTPSGEPDSESDWAEEKVRAFLAENSGLLDQIEAAAIRQMDQEKGVFFPRKYNSINTLLPNVQHMRSLARMIYLRGQVALYDGDADQLARSLKALIGLPDVLKEDPFIISQLVRIALQMMGNDLLQQSLAHDALPAADYQALLPAVLERTNISDDWSVSLIGERGIMLRIFDDPAASGVQMPTIPLRANDKLFFMEHIQSVLDVPTDDLNQFREGIEEQEAVLSAAMNGSMFSRLETLTSSLLMPSLEAASDAFVRNAMHHRLAALGIAVKLFEAANGRLPSEIAELEQVETLPPLERLTPIGKKPFGYLVDEAGATVWGFDPRTTLETPAEPSVPASEADAESVGRWNWTIPASKSTKDE